MGQNFSTQSSQVKDIWNNDLKERIGHFAKTLKTNQTKHTNREELDIPKLMKNLDNYLEAHYPTQYEILKKQNYQDLHEAVISLVNTYCNHDRSRPNATLEDFEINEDELQADCNTTLPSSSSSSCLKQKTASADNYDIDPNNPGVCLIIDQEHFYGEFDPKYKHLRCNPSLPLEERRGTKIDSDKLAETFKLFSYTVVVKRNLTHYEMEAAIEDVVMSVKEHSSLVICILSHGLEGVVFGSNSISISFKSIKETMCTKNIQYLEGKPKILILQSCQGDMFQEGNGIAVVLQGFMELEEDGPVGKIPTSADVLTFYATVPGFSAIRDINRGTWFIQALCKRIVDNYRELHFDEICTLVVREVTEKRWENKAMVSLKESTLTKFLYLPAIQLLQDDFEFL